MKFNKQIISKLSKLNKHDVNLNTLKININVLVKKLFITNLINIKPITNPLNKNYYLVLRKDKIKTNKKLKTYIGSAPKKTKYYILIPNIL